MFNDTRSSLLALICLALPHISSAQSPAAPASNPDHAQEAFVIEQYIRQVKVENDGTSTRVDTERVRIQSDAGVQRYGLLTLSYASAIGSFEIDHVRVRKPNGTVVDTPAENIQDMPAPITRDAPYYSDLREKHVAVKGLGVGDVLEFEIREQVTKPLSPGQFWFDYTFAKDVVVLQEQFEITLPRERPIKVKSPGFKPTISESGPRRIYQWTNANLQVKEEEKDKQKKAKQSWEQARGRLPHPDVTVSSFQSWEDVGRWYGNLQAERVKPGAEIRAKAAELTHGLTNEESKLHAIYNYVSLQFRYIGVAFGIGRYQPHAAAEVLANQYGDCKDKHTLLASLLDAVGIKAYPALISSVYEPDSDVPSPSQFNHVITVVPRGSSLIWLDTTAEVGPFAYLLPPLRDKQALMIPEDKPAYLAATPADIPYPGLQKFEIDAKLSDTGTLEGKATQITRGDTEVLLRAAFRRVPISQWKELAQAVSFGLGFGGEVSDITVSPLDKTDEPLRLGYSYKRKDYSEWSDRRIISPLPVISLPAIDDESDSESNAPEVPLWLGASGEIHFHAQLELPKSYVPKLPKAVHIKKDFADFDSSYSAKSGVLTADRHLVIKAREVPPTVFADYKTLRKAIQDDHAAYTTLSTGKSVTTASYQEEIWDLPYTKNTEAARLYDDARQKYEEHNTEGEIWALKRAVELDPRFTRAWLWLGEIYKANRQMDLALQCYRKAIEIEPQQPVSYKALAFTLMLTGKLEDSIPVWQQLAKVAPEDSSGPAGLASAQFLLHRYSEAASALEGALKLDPDNAGLQWQLASVNLRAGADDKAATMFRKVINDNPGPELANNAAYEMAEAEKQLPLALEFAEKAVSEEEENSSKIDFALLQADDLAHTQRLTAYWDTLGWVHNRMNTLDQAEKYLNAAWKISQNGVTASHLCQVYERQHKTQAAIQMCRFALYRLPLQFGPGMYQGSQEMGVAKKRLQRLLGPKSKPQAAENMVTISNEINRLSVFKLPRIVQKGATAEFFVLFAPDMRSGTFKVQDVRFISGSDLLKSSGKLLTSIAIDLPAPDHRPTRFVRRGILGCYEYSGCSFVMLDPSAVHSVD